MTQKQPTVIHQVEDLIITPQATRIYTGGSELLLAPRNITITDIKCGVGHATLSLDDLITYYEQHIEGG